MDFLNNGPFIIMDFFEYQFQVMYCRSLKLKFIYNGLSFQWFFLPVSRVHYKPTWLYRATPPARAFMSWIYVGTLRPVGAGDAPTVSRYILTPGFARRSLLCTNDCLVFPVIFRRSTILSRDDLRRRRITIWTSVRFRSTHRDYLTNW